MISADIVACTPTVAVPMTPKAEAFPLGSVRLLDGPFKQAQELDRRFLLEIDARRLLVPFREVANLPVTKKRYGGWESRGLSGHSLGHYLSACALMFAATGDPLLKGRVDYVVAQLAEVQTAHGNGYVAGIPENLFTECFAGGPLRGWVPWYNVHKTFAGLVDARALAGNQQAVDVASKFAAWAKRGTDAMSDEQFQKMLSIEHGGMNEALADLSALTGNVDQLALARRFCHSAVLDPLSRGEDRLTGLHANTQIPKVVGAARLYELTGEAPYGAAARNFWEDVVRRRSYVTGSNSEHEHFFPLGEEAAQLGTESAESCNVYNLLKLTRHLFAWEPSAEQMDFYERALVDHILGSIDPDSGMAIYFLSLKPGHFKIYGTPDNSWWCCTGTGLENHARYGESVYFHNADSLWVNLFVASELNWSEKKIVVRQETAFPASDRTELTIKAAGPVSFALRLRIPEWATRGVTLKINGELQRCDAKPQSYFVLQREWHDHDRVELTLPMGLRVHRTSDDSETAAILYGPIVLAGALGRENMPVDRQGDHLALDFWPTPPVPVLVSDEANLETWIKPVPGQPMHFKTVGAGRPSEVELMPLYALHHQRYTVYWKLVGSKRWETIEKQFTEEAEFKSRRDARVVDAIGFGEQQAEVDHHVLSDERGTTGNFGSKLWRSAPENSWFSCDLKVLPDRPMTVRCTYWLHEGRDRTFELVVDGASISVQRLPRNQADRFAEFEYAIPPELTRGKNKVTLRFQSVDSSPVGAVYHCEISKSSP